jgi:TolA-binding protein
MSDILFKDFSDEVNAKIRQLGVEWLEEASGEIEAQTKRNTRVDTGKTKGSWEHIVDEKKLEAQVGSRYKNAVWEEFGTGVYALNGNGRKDVPWFYKDEQGKWHRTSGKKPSRAFHNAYSSLKNSVIRSAQQKFRSIKK